MRMSMIIATIWLAGCQANTPANHPMDAAHADRQYLQQMADRNQDMIEMATIAEQKASDEHLRNMAHNSIAKQQADMHAIQQLLASRYGASYTPKPTSDGQQTLDSLKTRNGRDFDRAYLNAMIREYQANVEISRPIADSSSHADEKNFAQQIVKEQSHQVTHLQEHLAEVTGHDTTLPSNPGAHDHAHEDH